MVLKALLIVNRGLDGNCVADEEGIANFHTRHEIIEAVVEVHQFAVGS